MKQPDYDLVIYLIMFRSWKEPFVDGQLTSYEICRNNDKESINDKITEDCLPVQNDQQL